MSQVIVSLTVVSTPSTAITFTPSAGQPFTAPVPVGTIMGTFAVTPAGWNGTIALSGVNAGDFTLDASLDLVAAAALAVGTYDVTATATP